MFIHYRTLGLVFKKEERGEADRLFTFYTKDFGRLEILGKAIRKASSKLRSGCDIFYLSNIEFIQGKTHKTLTEAVLINRFENLRRNLKRLTIAHKISEVLDSLVRDQEKDEKIWLLISETFNQLNSPSLLPDNYFLIYYFFIWNLFSFLGYKPELYHCSLCQKRLYPGRLYFVPSEGGAVCRLCFGKIKKFKAVNDDFIKILRIILKKDWLMLKKLKFNRTQDELLEDASNFYLSFIRENVTSERGRDYE